MYQWNKLSQKDRDHMIAIRKGRKHAWHAPPHWEYEGNIRFFITATCYKHQKIIGHSAARMSECETAVLDACAKLEAKVYSWCILPNHYHLLALTDRIDDLRSELGQFHGRSSYEWNGQDKARGRKVWYKALERPMRSERHFWATMNYIHNNPVKHGYVKCWQDWPYSSSREFIEKVGREEAERIWYEYPIRDYGKKWDFD